MPEKQNSKLRKLAGNDDMLIYAARKERYAEGLPAYPVLHSLKNPDLRARMAISCIERWGLVMGESDGEDSAGRQKGRRMQPTEIVRLACECADEAYKQFEQRGWFVTAPPIEELIDAVKDQEDDNN